MRTESQDDHTHPLISTMNAQTTLLLQDIAKNVNHEVCLAFTIRTSVVMKCGEFQSACRFFRLRLVANFGLLTLVFRGHVLMAFCSAYSCRGSDRGRLESGRGAGDFRSLAASSYGLAANPALPVGQRCFSRVQRRIPIQSNF